MKQEAAVKTFEALSSPIRLAIFRLLIKKGKAGLVAGEISEMLKIPSTNLSFHLKTLVHAGLLNSKQEGRFQRFRANIDLILTVIEYLTEACCSGHPEECQNLRQKYPGAEPFLPPLTDAPSKRDS